MESWYKHCDEKVIKSKGIPSLNDMMVTTRTYVSVGEIEEDHPTRGI